MEAAPRGEEDSGPTRAAAAWRARSVTAAEARGPCRGAPSDLRAAAGFGAAPLAGAAGAAGDRGTRRDGCRSRAATVVVLPAARCAVHVTYQRGRPILERP